MVALGWSTESLIRKKKKKRRTYKWRAFSGLILKLDGLAYCCWHAQESAGVSMSGDSDLEVLLLS